jgi:hypothetical protein
MAKNNFSEINWKAATITGAVLGFLWWLVMVPWYGMMGFSTYGMMGYMMGYTYSVFTPLSVIVVVICGAIAGLVIAVVYNWALKLK